MVHDNNNLKTTSFDTPLGSMIAIADEQQLYLLEFANRKNLAREITRLKLHIQSEIIAGTTEITHLIENEITQYFNGQLKYFTTPLFLLGSNFQTKVWEVLQKIPHGETCSYLDIAKAIDAPNACRAAANANGANQLAIIIPCHRVINSNGQLGGYAGGITRKQWLLEHEKNTSLIK